MAKPQFSRSGQTSPFGKLDDRIEPFAIEGEVKAGLLTRAAREGMSLSEYVREILRIAVFGRSMVGKVHAQRTARIGRNLSE